MARPIPLVVVVGALLAPTCLAQDEEAWRTTEDPLHQVLDVVLSEDDPVLEGHGFSRAIEHDAVFSGTLYIWAQSNDLDPFLQVEVDWAFDSEDDDSGGGTTACIELEVEAEQALRILAAAVDPGAAGVLELHLVAAPETDATCEAARWARERLEEVERLRAFGDLSAARTVLARILERLEAELGAEQSARIAAVLGDLGVPAYEAGALETASSALEKARSHREQRWTFGARRAQLKLWIHARQPPAPGGALRQARAEDQPTHSRGGRLAPVSGRFGRLVGHGFPPGRRSVQGEHVGRAHPRDWILELPGFPLGGWISATFRHFRVACRLGRPYAEPIRRAQVGLRSRLASSR